MPNRVRISQLVSCAFLVGGVVCAGFALGLRGQESRKSTDPPVPPKGKLGQDLFLAIDHEDVPGVQALLKKGADPNSTNGLMFSPLYIAAASHQQNVMEDLLNAGAKPDYKTVYGTPLTFAAMTGNAEGASLLLSHNVDPDPVRTDGMTPLMMASAAGNPALVIELLKHKVDVNAQDDGGDTALIQAARNGFLEIGKSLIGAGGKVNTADMDGLTPLMAAADTGHADFTRLLLENGASPDAKDKAGRTALILTCMYGDYPETVQSLLDGHADRELKVGGRNAAEYAGARGYRQSVKVLTGMSADLAESSRSVHEAVVMSMKMIEKSTSMFDEGASCVSCHQEGIGRIATGEAARHGIQLDGKLQSAQTGRINGMLEAMLPLHQQAVKNPEAMKQIPLMEINEVSDMDSWLLSGLAAHKQAPNQATAAMALCLARQQSPDGSWTFSVPRVPLQSSFFTFTALAVHSLETYGPKAEAAEMAQRIDKAKAWLLSAKPQTSEDRASRLLGLKWAGADASAIQQASEAVLSDQKPDGGWSQMPNLESDAYATGQALYALHVGGGLPIADRAYLRGMQFLIRTQDDDGTWFVNKRAIPANNYFDAGFPHGESQYASFNGTCWATLALLQALPGKG